MTDSKDSDLRDMSMMELFQMEAENQCAQLAEDLLALEQDPTAAELLESLMRASHSVKGAARVVELKPAVEVAHAMEDVFVAAQNNIITMDRDSIDKLLKGIDMLNSIARLPEENTENLPAGMTDAIKSLVHIYGILAQGKKPDPENRGAFAAGSPNIPSPVPAASAEETVPLPVDLSEMTMQDLFRMEAENHCARLSENLTAFENHPSASDDLLQSMIRSSRSMKDAATIVELHGAVKLAHAMEEVFDAALKKKNIISRNAMAVLHHGVTLLTAITRFSGTEREKWLDAHNEEITELVKKLALLSRGKLSANNASVDQETLLPGSASASPVSKNADDPAKPTETDFASENETKYGRRAEDKDGARVVRVSAGNMDRMMGLAGESLIESRWLPTFNKELMRLKSRQDELYQYLDKIRQNLQTRKNIDLALNHFADLQDKLEQCRSLLTRDMEVLEDHTRHTTAVSHRLYEEIITSRMRPFSEGIRGFARMVRDVARELGKEVNFEITGADTLVDRDILDKIEAPLNHLLRNALDHGIEFPSERVAKGKPARGTISLIARHSVGMLNIIVRDDGRGIDLENLRRTIVEKNLCTSTIAANLSEQELLAFFFLPNFSTKKNVSNVSGRGVGLDVVHAVINEIRGKIRSSTKLDGGSSFELQLPLTLSVIRALITEINSELYGFPLASIDHVLQVTPDQIQEVENRQYFTYNDKRIGIVAAQQIFKTETPSSAAKENLYVIVFSDRLNIYGLNVDKLLGVRSLVVQSLDSRLGKIKNIASAAILADGSPVLIIDVDDVFTSLEQLISGNQLIPIGSGKKAGRKKQNGFWWPTIPLPSVK